MPLLPSLSSADHMVCTCRQHCERSPTVRPKYPCTGRALFSCPQHALSLASCLLLMKCVALLTIQLTPSVYGGVVSEPVYSKICMSISTSLVCARFTMLLLAHSNR